MENQAIYIVYKVTNLVNSKIYIGRHKQYSYDFDGYLGSGELIKKALSAHGISNFERETLFTYSNLEDAINKEKELVTEDFIKSESNYNLIPGGEGDFFACNTPEIRLKAKEIRKKNLESRGLYEGFNLHTPEVALKRESKVKEYYESKGLSRSFHLNNPEAQKKARETKHNTRFDRCYSNDMRASALIEVFNDKGEIFFEGKILEWSIIYSGDRYAISCRKGIYRKLDSNDLIYNSRSKFAGYYIRYKEKSAETKLDSLESREGSSEPVADNTLMG